MLSKKCTQRERRESNPRCLGENSIPSALVSGPKVVLGLDTLAGKVSKDETAR
jgi:hypothetical protein